ncbi:O-antigen ligase family protein [Klebsiella aerogenes]
MRSLNGGLVFPGLLLLILSLPWPTLPGQGLTVTLSLLVWLWGTLCSAALLWVGRHRRQWRGGWPACVLLAGLLLMSLPLLWTPDGFRLAAFWRLAGMGALLLFFLALRQYPFRGAVRDRLYALVVLAALIQSAFVVLQLGFPAQAHALLHYSFTQMNGRPTGTLLQTNLLGSFLATGLLCALWRSVPAMSWRAFAARGGAVVILSAALVMTESRTALLGGGLAAIMLLGLARFTPVSRRGALVVLLLVGGLAGHAGLSARPAALPVTQAGDVRPADTAGRLAWNRQQSGHERRVMLQGARAMIADRPLAGQGLATFETRFPAALSSAGIANPFTVTVTHPHNELLYVWSEGGLAALAGLLLWGSVLAWPVLNVVTAPRRWRVAARGVLVLPLALHLMTELPLYLSAAHGILLAVLLRLALPSGAGCRQRARPAQPRRVRGGVVAGLVVCAAGALFMATALQSAFRLQDAERFHLMDPTPLTQLLNPYAQSDRLLFDQAVSDLMTYNLTQDPALIGAFRTRATDWLSRHNDASLTATLQQIALSEHRFTDALYWQQRGCRSFARDPRFHCHPDEPSVRQERRNVSTSSD